MSSLKLNLGCEQTIDTREAKLKIRKKYTFKNALNLGQELRTLNEVRLTEKIKEKIG